MDELNTLIQVDLILSHIETMLELINKEVEQINADLLILKQRMEAFDVSKLSQ